MRNEAKIITNSITLSGFRAVITGAILSWLIFPEPYIIYWSTFMKILVLLISLVGGVTGCMLNLVNTRQNLKT